MAMFTRRRVRRIFEDAMERQIRDEELEAMAAAGGLEIRSNGRFRQMAGLAHHWTKAQTTEQKYAMDRRECLMIELARDIVEEREGIDTMLHELAHIVVWTRHINWICKRAEAPLPTAPLTRADYYAMWEKLPASAKRTINRKFGAHAALWKAQFSAISGRFIGKADIYCSHRDVPRVKRALPAGSLAVFAPEDLRGIIARREPGSVGTKPRNDAVNHMVKGDKPERERKPARQSAAAAKRAKYKAAVVSLARWRNSDDDIGYSNAQERYYAAHDALFDDVVAYTDHEFVYGDLRGQAALYADGSALLIADSAGWHEVDTYAEVIAKKADKARVRESLCFDASGRRFSANGQFRLDGFDRSAACACAPYAKASARAPEDRARFEDLKAEADRREAAYQRACEGDDKQAELAAKRAVNGAWWDAEKALIALGERGSRSGSR